MKKILLATLLVIALAWAQKALAIFLPFGGLTVTTMAPGAVQCAGTGPITMVPFTTAPPGLYYIAPGTPALYGGLRPGAFTLGLYIPIPVTGPCINPETGIPVPVFPFIMYGASM